MEIVNSYIASKRNGGIQIPLISLYGYLQYKYKSLLNQITQFNFSIQHLGEALILKY